MASCSSKISCGKNPGTPVRDFSTHIHVRVMPFFIDVLILEQNKPSP
jgi:hypothetical protein